MRLTLRYKGPLPAAGSCKNRVGRKHKIRLQLHDQLAAYWQSIHRLKEMHADLKSLQVAKRASDQFVVDRPLADGTKFWWRWPLCGFDFIPLVTEIHRAHCELKFRIYRKTQGILFEGGDIDNRLKTFFDALQVPKDASQVPTNPSASENPIEWPPLLCLLDNDNMITKLSIESFRLLLQFLKGSPQKITSN
jgi:hypothetical protein